jgi:hypothetical protein
MPDQRVASDASRPDPNLQHDHRTGVAKAAADLAAMPAGPATWHCRPTGTVSLAFTGEFARFADVAK